MSGIERSISLVATASYNLAEARRKYAEAFLLAKLGRTKPTDRQAEASAEVETGNELVAAETSYFLAKVAYMAAAGVKAVI